MYGVTQGKEGWTHHIFLSFKVLGFGYFQEKDYCTVVIHFYGLVLKRTNPIIKSVACHTDNNESVVCIKNILVMK